MTSHDDDNNIPTRHLCPLPHRGHATHIHPPHTICNHHTDRIRDTITDTRRLWDTLPDLNLTARDGTGTPGGTKSVPPTRLDLLALTDPHTHWDSDIPPATRILLWLAEYCADTRRLTPPATPTAALSLLQVHHAALATHPQPRTVWQHLTRLHTHLRWITGETPTSLATCQQPTDPQHPDTECGGPIYHHPGSRWPARCARCGDAWTEDGLLLAWDQMRLANDRTA